MRNPLKIVAEKILTSERFKGFFDTGKTARKGRTHYYLGEHSWRERCKRFDRTYQRHPLAKQAMLTIAGQLVAEGVFTEAQTRFIEDKEQSYPRSEEAQHQCDDLNARIGLDTMLYETGVVMAKYGSCFWEKTWEPQFDVRLIPMQETIEPAEVNNIGEITAWRQNLWSTRQSPTWQADQIVHFAWNVTSESWPYGTSILVGLDTEFEILEELEQNAKDYMEKQAWPYEMGRVGDGQYMPDDTEMASIKSKWKNRQIGENILTSYPIEMIQGGTGGAPIRELSNIFDFIKDNIVDGTMVPPISKQYNATEASAKIMMPHAHATLITPMQRLIRRKVENEVYKPYLEDLGYSVKTCPKLLFEPPDAHKEEDAEYYSKLVLAGVIPPKAAAKELGYEEEFEEWMKEEEKRQQKMMQQGEEQGEEEETEQEKQKPPIKEQAGREEQLEQIITQLRVISNRIGQTTYKQKRAADLEVELLAKLKKRLEQDG